MLKKLTAIIVLLITGSLSGFGQEVNSKLHKADSLFAIQHYTQSFDLYKTIYEKDKLASNSMLLKMAYIKEGLGDITSAEYYLNEYYLATSNEQALNKMEKLAEAYDLHGYGTNDITFFFNIYFKHYNLLVFGIISVIGLVFIFMIIRKRKYNMTSYGTGAIIFLLLISLFYLVNFGREYKKGLIRNDHTFVMSAPSSGSEVLDVITKGHKVAIKGQTDVWLKITWDNREVYVKAKNVRLLSIW